MGRPNTEFRKGTKFDGSGKTLMTKRLVIGEKPSVNDLTVYQLHKLLVELRRIWNKSQKKSKKTTRK